MPILSSSSPCDRRSDTAEAQLPAGKPNTWKLRRIPPRLARRESGLLGARPAVQCEAAPSCFCEHNETGAFPLRGNSPGLGGRQTFHAIFAEFRLHQARGRAPASAQRHNEWKFRPPRKTRRENGYGSPSPHRLPEVVDVRIQIDVDCRNGPKQLGQSETGLTMTPEAVAAQREQHTNATQSTSCNTAHYHHSITGATTASMQGGQRAVVLSLIHI